MGELILAFFGYVEWHQEKVDLEPLVAPTDHFSPYDEANARLASWEKSQLPLFPFHRAAQLVELMKQEFAQLEKTLFPFP